MRGTPSGRTVTDHDLHPLAKLAPSPDLDSVLLRHDRALVPAGLALVKIEPQRDVAARRGGEISEGRDRQAEAAAHRFAEELAAAAGLHVAVALEAIVHEVAVGRLDAGPELV